MGLSRFEEHLLTDQRLHQRFLRDGVLTPKDVERQNAELPDVKPEATELVIQEEPGVQITSEAIAIAPTFSAVDDDEPYRAH